MPKDRDLEADRERRFSNETMISLRDLGGVLESILRRLKADGYTVKDGKLHKQEML